MKKLLLLLLLSIIVASNVNGQGLKLSSPDNINNFEEFKSDDFGFASSIPSSYDLKKYVIQTNVGEEVIITVLKPFEEISLKFTVKIQKLSNDSIPISIIETLESEERDDSSVRLNLATNIKLMENSQLDIVVVLDSDTSKELENFDQIVSVGNEKIRSIEDFKTKLEEYRGQGKDQVPFIVKRRPKDESSYCRSIVVNIDIGG